MENIKTTASDAVANVQEQGQSAVSDVKDSAADARDHVRHA